MQLTEETARHLGVADRLDPRQSALAAARYLRDLKDRTARPHRGAGPHVARARRVQHRPRPPRGRAHPRAEAEAQSGPLARREADAAAARAARVLREGEARLRTRRHAGRLRRPRARVLRHPAAPGSRAGRRGFTRPRANRTVRQSHVELAYDAPHAAAARSLLVARCVLLRACALAARADARQPSCSRNSRRPELRTRLREAGRRSSSRSAAPSRTARTWRWASTTCRAALLAERDRRALGNALVAPVIAYVPEGERRTRRRATCASRHDHRAAGDVRARARIGGAQLPPRTASATSCCSAITATTSRTTPHRGASSTASGRRRRCAPTRSPSTTACRHRRTPSCCASAASPTRRSASTRDSPTRRSCSRSIPHSCASTACRRAAAGRRRRRAGDPRRASAETRRLGVDVIVAQTVEAIRRSGRPCSRRLICGAHRHPPRPPLIPPRPAVIDHDFRRSPTRRLPACCSHSLLPLVAQARTPQPPAAPAAATAVTTVPGMPPACRSRQPVQRADRRQAAARRSPATCRASTCRTSSRTTST